MIHMDVLCAASSAHFALANGYFTRGDLEDGLCHAREVPPCADL